MKKGFRVLLAEDEKWVRIALRKVLEKVSLDVQLGFEATNGLEALDWLKSNEADLVITDIRMPVMDGLALLTEMRAGGMDTDVIIVSGHDDFAYAQQALRQGAADYLLKPVELEALEESLHRWLQKRASAAKQAIDIGEPAADLSPVERVIRHIRMKRQYSMSSAEAAAFVHLNPSYFSKLFKQTTSMTFTDYVTRMRMDEAVKLLIHTSLRITEIAERVGYADPAYFSNSFKKLYGLTPKEYRRNQTRPRRSIASNASLDTNIGRSL